MKLVEIYLPLDCSSETIDPWTIANQTIVKIKNFLEGIAGADSEEKFDSKSSILEVFLTIPVNNIDAAKAVETKLENNIAQFPPIPKAYARWFKYLSQ